MMAIAYIVGGIFFFFMILVPIMCLTNLSRLREIELHMAFIGSQLDRIANILESKDLD